MAQTGIKVGLDKHHFSDCDEAHEGVRSFKFNIFRGTQAIGWIQGFKINRNQIRRCRDFHLALEGDTAECYEFAKTLFEQYSGKLRPEFYSGNAYDRGTGAFGREIDSANFMFIDEMVIKQPEDRHKGVGSLALSRFLNNSSLSDIGFVFVCPDVLLDYDESRHVYDERRAQLCQFFGEPDAQDPNAAEQAQQLRQQQKDRIVAFYRKNGFRRVGNSEYFAYAKDPSHPSRSIAVASDAAGRPRVRPAQELRAAFPLHARIEGADDIFEMPALEATINSAKLSELQVQDDYGMTPLHMAAKDGKYRLVHAILRRSKAELFVQDVRGLTPVQHLERSIKKIEEWGREKMSDVFSLASRDRDLAFIEKFSKPLALEMRAMMAALQAGTPEADPKPDPDPSAAAIADQDIDPSADPGSPSDAPVAPMPIDQDGPVEGSDSAPAQAAYDGEDEPEEEYEIEAILKSRKGYFASGEMAYFVTWKGYDASHNSWVSESDAGNASELIEEYWKAQSAKKTKGRKSEAATPSSTAAKDSSKSNRGGRKSTRLSNSSTAVDAAPSSVAAKDDAKSTQVGRKRTRLSDSTTAVNDSDGPDDADDSRASKSRKLDGKSSPGSIASPAAEEELEEVVASMDAYMHVSSWEDLVDKIVSVYRAEDGILKAYMELADGTKAEHESAACRERCPMKLIDFYEKNLRWRENP